MWLAYYGHDLEDSHMEHVAKEQARIYTITPTPELGIREPVEKEDQRETSSDSLDEVITSPTDCGAPSDAKSFPLIVPSSCREAKLREKVESSNKGALDEIIAEVRASIREEVVTVLMAVEGLRSEIVERWDCAEKYQSTRENAEASGVNSVVDSENLNSGIEESRGDSMMVEMQQSLEVTARTVSTPVSSLPRDIAVGGDVMELDGYDLRRSLLSPSNGTSGYLPLDAVESTNDGLNQDKMFALRDEIERLRKDEIDKTDDFKSWEAHFEKRRDVMSAELEDLRERIVDLQKELDDANDPTPSECQPIAAGQQSLSWVDGAVFSNASMVVIALNLALMFAQPVCHPMAFWIFDQIFLVWYIFELLLKFKLHRSALFFGSLHVVSWNWLDLWIVVSGVFDQWIIGLWNRVMHSKASVSTVNLVRAARIFRLLRALRFMRMFLKSDTSWAEGPAFRNILLSTISVNSVVMPLELEFDWEGWRWIEHVFLIIYFVEMVTRLKTAGASFFRCSNDGVWWNYIDFFIVVGGVLDSWLIPLMNVIQSLLVGKRQHAHYFFRQWRILLKVMRIVRVLRLVRLMREMKPLYDLFIDFYRSLKAMQWVLLLTLLVLYAGAIAFTDLVGKGNMYVDTDLPEGSSDYFGSFGTSMFSLFKLMNGDSSVVEPITSTLSGRMLVVCFMVISNWSLLAIMTSTVSDHLISTSALQQKEQQERRSDDDFREQSVRLSAVFKAIDADGSGYISRAEWENLMNNSILSKELCNASKLDLKDLREFFDFLSEDVDPTTTQSRRSGCCINYDIFMQALKDERVLATKRSILHLLAHLRHVEGKLESIERSIINKKTSIVSSSLARVKVLHML